MTSLAGDRPLSVESRSQRPRVVLVVVTWVSPPLPQPRPTCPRTTCTQALISACAGPVPDGLHCWTRPQPGPPVDTRSIQPVPSVRVVGSTRLTVVVSALFHSVQSSAAERSPANPVRAVCAVRRARANVALRSSSSGAAGAPRTSNRRPDDASPVPGPRTRARQRAGPGGVCVCRPGEGQAGGGDRPAGDQGGWPFRDEPAGGAPVGQAGAAGRPLRRMRGEGAGGGSGRVKSVRVGPGRPGLGAAPPLGGTEGSVGARGAGHRRGRPIGRAAVLVGGGRPAGEGGVGVVVDEDDSSWGPARGGGVAGRGRWRRGACWVPQAEAGEGVEVLEAEVVVVGPEVAPW